MKKKIDSHIPASILIWAIFCVFLILPLGLFIKNVYPMLALRGNTLAENLGEDIINNTSQHSLFVLSMDTIIFNSQYVYFDKKENYTNHILIHASKLSFPFYQKALAHNYPALKINPKHKKVFSITQLIQDNVKKYDVYSNDRYPIPGLPDYKWVPQGLLFKLVPLKNEYSPQLVESMNNFWKRSKNTYMLSSIHDSSLVWKHNFLNEIRNVYATAHQNTAYFYLQRNLLDKALPHILAASRLNNSDKDSVLLLAQYHEKKKQCEQAEQTIRTVLKGTYDETYASELKIIAESCYGDQGNKNRISNDLMKLQRLQTPSLKTF